MHLLQEDAHEFLRMLLDAAERDELHTLRGPKPVQGRMVRRVYPAVPASSAPVPEHAQCPRMHVIPRNFCPCVSEQAIMGEAGCERWRLTQTGE